MRLRCRLRLATILRQREFEQIRELLCAGASENQAEEISNHAIDSIQRLEGVPQIRLPESAYMVAMVQSQS